MLGLGDSMARSVDVGLLLQKVRNARGYSKAEMARKLQTSASHIDSVENGDVSIKIDTLKRWAEALGCDLKIDLEDR